MSVEEVAERVAQSPGLGASALAAALGGRRATRLEQIREAERVGLIHAEPLLVPASHGRWRARSGYHPGAGHEVRPLTAGDLIRERRAAGLSQDDLAQTLGVRRQMVSRWELGQRPVPLWVAHDLADKLDANRGSVRRVLLERIDREPGVTTHRLRWTISRSRALLLELDALQAEGRIHLATSWDRTGHAYVGYYPGPRHEEPEPVRVAELRAARLAAHWSQHACAERLGIAPPTLGNYERAREYVPGWLSVRAREVLLKARAIAAELALQIDDLPDLITAAVQADPGISRKQLARRVYRSRGEHIATALDELLEAGVLHERAAGRRGQLSGVYPGPAPADVLTADQIKAERKRTGLLQRDLANLAGLNIAVLAKYEQGGAPVPLEVQQRLLQVLTPLSDAADELGAELLEVITEQPRTRHQLEQLRLASRADVDAALVDLEEAGRIHQGRYAATGRRAYLAGPAT